MRRETLEIHLESTQWISTHVLFWIFFPTILWEMTTCNLHQWIMNVPLLLLEAEKKNYKSTLKHRSFRTAVGSFLPIKTSRGRMAWLRFWPKIPFKQVAPYGELGRRFAVAKPKEVQRVRSRRCYWMVGSSTQGESAGRGRGDKKVRGGGGVTLPETKILVAPKNGGSRGALWKKRGLEMTVTKPWIMKSVENGVKDAIFQPCLWEEE